MSKVIDVKSKRFPGNWREVTARVFVWLGLVIATGCSATDHELGTQTVVAVDQREVTKHEVDIEMARLGLTDPVESDAGHNVAVALVERTLLAHKSLALQLDRDPTVLQLLRATRDQVLAEAYLERLDARIASVSSEQIQDYYDAHPELFGKRRGYHFRELIVDVATLDESPPDTAARLHNMDALVHWLRARSASFASRESYAGAEWLSEAVLSTLFTLQPGRLVAVDGSDDAAHFVQLIGSADMPLSLGDAEPQIRTALMAAARESAVVDEVKRLATAARITWRGPFAQRHKDAPLPNSDAMLSSNHVEYGLEGLQ